MKLKHITPFPKRLIKRNKHGFALIASLTLMMLLTLLAVGILAMASSQNRIALQTMLQAEARQQALVGLDAALGELQMAMGPDRRVSASSGITSENEGSVAQHILGVWNSWSGPIYGKPADGNGSSIKATYDKGRSSMFRQWLISSKNPAELRQIGAAATLGSRKPGTRICLVGEGTLGKRLTGRHYVYADMISMPASGKNTACFAWWVGGENQKSKISIVDPEEDTNPIEVLHRTWNTPGPLFVDSEYLDFLPETVEKPEKVLTMASLPLLSNGSQPAGMPYFFDVTTSSYSLPVNVRTGGLKQDLCLLLNKKSLKNTEFSVRSKQDCPIAEGNDVPRGTEANMPIGSWQNLYAYYNCWPDGSANDGKNFTSRLIGSLENCYTRMSGSGTTLNQNDFGDLDGKSNSNGTAFDSRAMMDQGSSSAGYARTPVMLAFMNTFGLVTQERPGVYTSDDTKQEDKNRCYYLRLCFAPMFLWWNPYNVPMRIRGKQLWAQSVPYKNTWIQTYSNSTTTALNYKWSTYAMQQTSSASLGTSDDGTKYNIGFGQDWGNFFLKNKNGDTQDIIFEPGEILFFSPATARSAEDASKPYSNPWAVGYDASAVAGYYAHFYGMKSSSTNPCTNSKEHIENRNFYIRLRLGINGDAGSYNTDGHFFAPNQKECITVLNGFAGMENSGDAGTDGKLGMSPQRMLLGWYDPDNPEAETVFCDENRNDSYWTADGTQSDLSIPYFVAALGVVAKTGNRNMDARIFTGKDYRTKSWQHSNPAFWGGAIAKPDDQMRQYHPYQLAALDVGSGMNACPMDNVGDNGVLGISGDGEQVSFVSCLELPVHPPFSLAGFAGMRLQPGWYESGSETTISRFRRMQYQSGVPGVGIGNSFADPCLPADDVYAMHESNMPTSGVPGNARLFSDFFDHGLLINDALWDRWFCSSISDMPTRTGKREAQEVAQAFAEGKEQLPVARYVKSTTPYDSASIVKALMAEDGWKKVAQYIMIDGGFNVNSTSEEAWAAMLQGLSKRLLVTNSGGKLQLVEAGKNRSQVLFSRFMVSTTDKSIDGLGGYSMMQGSSSLRANNNGASAWGEVRMLDSDVIRELSKEMVKQVKRRGPFLNMSDFINRRLASNSDDALKGALQAAIDETDINRDFNEVMTKALPGGSLYKYEKAEEGSIYTAAPGYLIQSDVLASLGNILTVRDDTFTVRAYGCVRNPRKAILAQAWCEAIVQRTADYIDPTNNPTDAEYEPDGRRSATGLSKANQVFGRKFRIVSFKWLDAWDI